MVRLWGAGGGVLVVLLMSRRVIIVSVSVGVSVIYLGVLVTILNIIHLLCIFDNIPNT